MNSKMATIKQFLKEKNYNECSYILRNEIVDIFTQKVQKENSAFKFTTLDTLKTHVIKYLDNNLIDIFNDFYYLYISEENTLIEFDELMDIYKKLEIK